MLGLQLRNIYKVVTVGELNNITNHGVSKQRNNNYDALISYSEICQRQL